jgi:hypothetical protein
MHRFLWENSLTLFFLLLLVLALIGQAFAGQAVYNSEQIADGADTVSLLTYVTSSDFAVNLAENWQSEYLQFFLYIFITVWLVQRGSPESKSISKAGDESNSEQPIGAHARPESPRWARVGGLRGVVIARSLGLG